MQFETDAGAIGTMVVSQVSAGRKNRLWLEFDGAEEAIAFDQEDPETAVDRPTARAATLVRRDPEHLSPPAARFATLPPGHPQGYADCFDAFVADTYAAIRGERARRAPAVRGRPARRHDHRRGARIVGHRRVGERSDLNGKGVTWSSGSPGRRRTSSGSGQRAVTTLPACRSGRPRVRTCGCRRTARPSSRRTSSRRPAPGSAR